MALGVKCLGLRVGCFVLLVFWFEGLVRDCDNQDLTGLGFMACGFRADAYCIPKPYTLNPKTLNPIPYILKP